MGWDSNNYQGPFNSNPEVLKCIALLIPSGCFSNPAEHLRLHHQRRRSCKGLSSNRKQDSKCKYNRISNLRCFIWEWVWPIKSILQNSLKGSLVETKRSKKSRLYEEDNRRNVLVSWSRNILLKIILEKERRMWDGLGKRTQRRKEKSCYSNSDAA